MDDTSPAPRWDAFLAFSSRDAAVAGRLHVELEARGIRTYFSPRTVPGGAEWRTHVLGALDGCRLVVALFSRNAAASPFFQDEVDRAVAHRRRGRDMMLLPVVLDDLAEDDPAFYGIGSLQRIRLPPGASVSPIVAMAVQRLATTALAANEPDPVPAASTPSGSITDLTRDRRRTLAGEVHSASFDLDGRTHVVRFERIARLPGSELRLLVDGSLIWSDRLFNAFAAMQREVPFRIDSADACLAVASRQGTARMTVTVAGSVVLEIA